ncbi:MAG TPA: hypothetical protein VF823_08690, partial [Anaerolineales bacterium]
MEKSFDALDESPGSDFEPDELEDSESSQAEVGEAEQDDIDLSSVDLAENDPLAIDDADGLAIDEIAELPIEEIDDLLADVDQLPTEEPDEEALSLEGEEWESIAQEDPLEILEDPKLIADLSEDPVRLYL